MHPKVVSVESWRTVKRVASAGLLDGWALAGGTGLALQLGHRRSEDFDFFRSRRFDPGILIQELSRISTVSIQDQGTGTLHILLDTTRFSFLMAQSPLLFHGMPYRGFTVADMRDIAVMKVIAVAGRGSRKDFIDLFFYLRAGGTIEGVFELLRRRFASVDFNEYHLLKSLVYFEDAEAEPMPTMLRPVAWPDVKARLVEQVRRLS